MIVPSIDVMNGRAVQLRQGREFGLDGGDPLERLEEFALAGEVAVVDLDAALGRGSNRAVIEAMVRRCRCRVGGGVRDVATALAWLDAGAAQVVIGTAATPEVLRELPRERVIAAVDARRGELVVNGWRSRTGRNVLEVVRSLAPYVSGFLLTQVEREGEMAGFDETLVRRVIQAAHGARVTAAGGITTADEIAALDRWGADAQVGMALYTGRLSLADAIAAPLDAGRAPWPTVVCDQTGEALGLAWSTPESLRRAVAERRGTYWSRSRQTIWVKGATSGATQALERVELDCDRDTLRFVVRQEGQGFCHRGTWSCWGDHFGLGQLERVIRSRAHSGDRASGTRRLLDDPALLRAKLVEEAAELAAAPGVEEAAAEAADLLYVALTALVARGGTLAQVETELARRARRVTRRPMTAKPDRESP
jgi:phosphoribosyl-ATP pyrophosphohydrolase